MNYANKAWISALVAALGTFLVSIKDKSTVETLTAVDWLIIVVTSVVSFLTVYAVSNGIPITRQFTRGR
jgi:hypothetical protein